MVLAVQHNSRPSAQSSTGSSRRSKLAWTMVQTGIVTACLTMLASACSPGPSDDNNLAAAYAEILVVQTIHRNDTVTGRQKADSVATTFGYDDVDDVLAQIKALTEEPERLRPVLDSAQRILEEIRTPK